jgi:hypothetical protein
MYRAPARLPQLHDTHYLQTPVLATELKNELLRCIAKSDHKVSVLGGSRNTHPTRFPCIATWNANLLITHVGVIIQIN